MRKIYTLQAKAIVFFLQLLLFHTQFPFRCVFCAWRTKPKHRIIAVIIHTRCGYCCIFLFYLITDEVMQYSNAFSMWLCVSKPIPTGAIHQNHSLDLFTVYPIEGDSIAHSTNIICLTLKLLVILVCVCMYEIKITRVIWYQFWVHFRYKRNLLYTFTAAKC